MATSEYVLFAAPTTWRIARVERGAIDWSDVAVGDESSADVASRVADALAAVGFAGRPVTLAIASGDCLAARIATDGLPRGDRKATRFRFEEKLPLAAEDVIADFVTFDAPTTGGDGALGVGAPLDRLRPVVAALEAAGVPVRSIVPAALAASQAMAGGGPASLVVLLAEPAASSVSVVALRAGRPFDWAVVPANVGDLRLHLAILGVGADAPPRVVALGLPTTLSGALAAAVDDRAGADLAATFCADAIANGATPWIELRRDALAAADRWRANRRPLNALLAAAALTLAVTTASLLVRSIRYARVESNARATMVADFRAQFPDWVVPANVRAVVEAEHRRAAAAATPGVADARADGGAWYGSAFTVLRDVLVSLPGDGGYALDRMSFQDASFELGGRLQSYEQVDAIATAARRSGMDVGPPQTRREAGGAWTFTLQGARPVGSTR